MAVLKPSVKGALTTQFGISPQFAEEVITWAVRQGIPADIQSPDFSEAVVRQAIYRLLGKIIFYQSLRRAIPTLPEMNMDGLDTAQVMPRLQECFNKAHLIDYHAVFREDVVDRLPFPAQASAELRDLVGVLNTRDFAHLPQDVVGAVFEHLIPPEDRHALGQFFTPENLVDLIVAFCVRNAEDAVMDPTCGTGTFLIRSYDRKRTALGLYDHSRQLSLLWGVDIAPFPAELATINLFRQQVGEAGNFPRILNEDFFNVISGGQYRFPPLKDDIPQPAGTSTEAESGLMVPIPQFDAIVGNFPYISADRIEQREKGYADKIARRLADDWFQTYPAGFTFESKADEHLHRAGSREGNRISCCLYIQSQAGDFDFRRLVYFVILACSKVSQTGRAHGHRHIECLAGCRLRARLAGLFPGTFQDHRRARKPLRAVVRAGRGQYSGDDFGALRFTASP